mmetsp:Transcript_19971/g.41103  ORF Transcript_19971/g.41103 Transcript_19971/m.41103 type:complete len:94 (-) Transcript_19971:532-813(-)
MHRCDYTVHTCTLFIRVVPRSQVCWSCSHLSKKSEYIQNAVWLCTTTRCSHVTSSPPVHKKNTMNGSVEFHSIGFNSVEFNSIRLNQNETYFK